MLGYLAKWSSFLGLWFLFVYQFSLFELLAGGGAAALTLIAIETARKHEPLRFEPRWRWIAQAWRLPAQVAKGIWTLGKSLARRIACKPSRSLFQLIPFDSPGGDPKHAGQRALVVLYGTMPPDSVIIGFDPARNMLMAHFLEPSHVPPMIREMETE
ncbi:MAG: hypothetical protein ACRD30_00335 [Bryobacteraceae bacterium]